MLVGTNHWVVVHINFDNHLISIHDSLVDPDKSDKLWHTKYDLVTKVSP